MNICVKQPVSEMSTQSAVRWQRLPERHGWWAVPARTVLVRYLPLSGTNTAKMPA